MSAAYTITTDAGRKLLKIRFSGFFSPADLSSYLAAKSVALARLGCRPNEHVTLCDFSACSPQSREVVEFLRSSIDDPTYRSRRLAVIVGSALAQFQAKRVITRADAACFLRLADAERWLFDEAPARLDPAMVAVA